MDFLTTETGAFYQTLTGIPYVLNGYTPEASSIQSFDFSVNLLQSLLWQYQNAPNLFSLVNQKQTWYNENQTSFWNDWFQDVFNLQTANQFGLSVWSVILGQPIFVNNGPNNYVQTPWGLGVNNVNFGNGNFGSATGISYYFPTEIARIVLQLRYFQLTSSGTVPETNRMLKWVFEGYGQAWLIDNHNMTQTYKFNFPLPSDLILAFQDFDILPRPAGVSSNYVTGP